MQLAQRLPTRAAAARPASRANSRLVCSAQHPARAQPSASGALLSAALTASLVASPALAPASAFGAGTPKTETTESFGAARTRALIDSQGTPGAARPDNMQTNVPFQAPGINAPPRGPKQESGSSVQTVLKDAGRSIKANARDPDSKPFGISTGPLVREAKKMGQPGNLRNLKRAGASRFKEMASDSPALKAVESVPSNSEKRGILSGRFTRLFTRIANKE